MANGLPGIGPVTDLTPNTEDVPKPKKEKSGFFNFSIADINWWGIGKIVILALGILGGSATTHHFVGGRDSDPALAAELEKVKGDVKMSQAITAIVQEQVKGIATKTDSTQSAVSELKTDTEVLKTKIDLLKETADKLDQNQTRLQSGIDQILQSLNNGKRGGSK